jgi:hypothetical protein
MKYSDISATLIYQELARLHQDYQRCVARNIPATTAALNCFINKYLPHPEGADQKTVRYDYINCKFDVIVLSLTYKRVDKDNMPIAEESLYRVYIKPTFLGIRLRVTSANRSPTKHYLYDYFYKSLMKQYEPFSVARVG